jgi:hypothetical protein
MWRLSPRKMLTSVGPTDRLRRLVTAPHLPARPPSRASRRMVARSLAPLADGAGAAALARVGDGPFDPVGDGVSGPFDPVGDGAAGLFAPLLTVTCSKTPENHATLPSKTRQGSFLGGSVMARSRSGRSDKAYILHKPRGTPVAGSGSAIRSIDLFPCTITCFALLTGPTPYAGGCKTSGCHYEGSSRYRRCITDDLSGRQASGHI